MDIHHLLNRINKNEMKKNEILLQFHGSNRGQLATNLTFQFNFRFSVNKNHL